MRITDEATLSEAIKGATRPIRPQGGATRVTHKSGGALDMTGLSGITLYEPGALTLVAQAGTPVHAIETALGGEDQRLAFEPYFLSEGPSTIGGVIATNASGPRRIQAGAARDFLLGVRFVDGAGRIIQNGGRVMKNVTGYDLVKLIAGSWGQLGVLSQVSLKVLPKPETTGHLVLHGLDAQGAVAAMSSALGSPFEVSGAAHMPKQQKTWLRIEGFETQVRYRLDKLKERLGHMGEISMPGTLDWSLLTQLSRFSGAGDLWRISVRPSDGPAVAARLPEDAPYMMDWGGGLIWARLNAAPDLSGLEGYATCLNGQVPEARAAVGVERLVTGLKSAFDPKGLFQGDQAA